MKLCKTGGVWFYRSELLPCPHGFATRIGGVSTQEHTKSLNLAFLRGDDNETVLQNLRRFTEAVGVRAESVISLPQVHGNTVLPVTEQDGGEGYFRKTERTADGYVTCDRTVTLGIKTADCVPILLCGLSESGDAVAVSALHAGWRGTVKRIAENGVRALQSFGIPADRIRAAIGPSIGVCCYEVDSAFRETFAEEFGEDFVRETIFEKNAAHGKYTADLKEINRRILQSAGVPADAIDVSEACTACSPDLFYSHRYSNGVRGTMLSVIALPPYGDREES